MKSSIELRVMSHEYQQEKPILTPDSLLLTQQPEVA